MKLFILCVAVFLAIPAARAQKANPDQAGTPAATTPATGTSDHPSGNTQVTQPGHPLDPADVDILTGKRDREIEASRRNTTILMDNYGDYASLYGRDGFEFNQRRIGIFDVDLPLRRVGNPFFFFNGSQGGFGSGGFDSRGGRTPRGRH